jgi:hypothetical protein
MERTLESTVLHVTRTRLVMGWDDAHVHRFCIRGREFGVYRPGGWLFSGDPEAICLRDFRFRPHEHFTYEYNFYAGWVHDIRLEKILPGVASKPYPFCTGGAGTGPLELCASPEHFMDQYDAHHPLRLWDRVEELMEEGDIDTLREELHDWKPWLEPDRFDRCGVNR